MKKRKGESLKIVKLKYSRLMSDEHYGHVSIGAECEVAADGQYTPDEFRESSHGQEVEASYKELVRFVDDCIRERFRHAKTIADFMQERAAPDEKVDMPSEDIDIPF